jgi:hypothetical protein
VKRTKNRASVVRTLVAARFIFAGRDDVKRNPGFIGLVLIDAVPITAVL